MNPVEALIFPPNGSVPNSLWPVLVYRATVAPEADAIETMFARHGWSNSWRNGIHPFHHFHSIVHEVLGVAAGQATVLLGGETGRSVTLQAGDVVVLPAGVGHKRLSATRDLVVVGAYPDGMDWDLMRAETLDEAGARRAAARAATVPLPGSDPVSGPEGPLLRHWRSRLPLIAAATPPPPGPAD